ncbi:hypothetical protein [Pseudopedobacter sp.]|uniref:hypothetical protein n=1 Tax=Pseudopedobacter sp. TaxID=1936787 RepID=UPI0033414022
MNVLVKVENKIEESVLLAFLAKRGYEFKVENDGGVEEETELIETLVEEQHDLAQLDSEIENGDYVDHRKVEILLNQRRDTIFK